MTHNFRLGSNCSHKAHVTREVALSASTCVLTHPRRRFGIWRCVFFTLCCWSDTFCVHIHPLQSFPLAYSSLSHSFNFVMVASNTLLANSVFVMGALAQPSVHRNLIGRAAATSSASIPAATTWDPSSNMVEALDQVSDQRRHAYQNY
jgi:hypothetical protein